MVDTETLNITSPVDVLDRLREAVSGGAYSSHDGVVVHALYDWQVSRMLEGVDVATAKQMVEVDETQELVPVGEVFERVRARYRAAAASAQ